MDMNKPTEKAQAAIATAQRDAEQRHHTQLEPEHLLSALVKQEAGVVPAVLEKLGRLFWYTVEFGLMREGNEIKVYGSGLISSHGECRNVVEGNCAVHDFSLDEVLATPVKVDEFQRVLFAIESFDQMYEAMHEAEQRVLENRI